jgi:Flp pilus assembly protein TadG
MPDALLKSRFHTPDMEVFGISNAWRRSVKRETESHEGPRTRSRRSRLAGESGAAAIEFAIVATIFFMLVFAVIDFGFGFHTWNATSNAAREGARLAAVDPDPVAITARVKAAASFLDQSRLTVTVTCSKNGGTSFSGCATWDEGDLVRVAVDYRYSFITPLPSFAGVGDDMQLHSQSESRFEGV